MGILKDTIRKVIEKDAAERGVDVQFLDTPTTMIESAEQAKVHDMEAVEGCPEGKKRKYAREVYKHNPSAYEEEGRDKTLYLYVLDETTNKAVAYLALHEHHLEVCTGCGYGDYNVWDPKSFMYGTGLTLNNIKRAVAMLENTYSNDTHQFIITRLGATKALSIPQGL